MSWMPYGRRSGRGKVGHGGTLDPDATGVLVVGVGKATRFLSFAQEAPKRYSARLRFGTTTSTQDASGEVLETHPVEVGRDEVFTELKRFVGPIEQVPPMVSAVKVGGERLHEKARRGEVVERRGSQRDDLRARHRSRSRRAITFELEFDVVCSAGTYVRTLAHDIGASLGCGAHLRTLRRTEAGGFRLDDTIDLDSVDRRAAPPCGLIGGAPASDEGGRREARAYVADGRPLPAPAELGDGDAHRRLQDGELLAVYRRSGDRILADRVVPR